MDGNRDEGQRCIDLAKKSILNNQTEKAIKYLAKAQRLYPSSEAKGEAKYHLFYYFNH